jgi:hypothetical protein
MLKKRKKRSEDLFIFKKKLYNKNRVWEIAAKQDKEPCWAVRGV